MTTLYSLHKNIQRPEFRLWNPKASRYTGAVLRSLRAERGVGPVRDIFKAQALHNIHTHGHMGGLFDWKAYVDKAEQQVRKRWHHAFTKGSERPAPNATDDPSPRFVPREQRPEVIAKAAKPKQYRKANRRRAR